MVSLCLVDMRLVTCNPVLPTSGSSHRRLYRHPHHFSQGRRWGGWLDTQTEVRTRSVKGRRFWWASGGHLAIITVALQLPFFGNGFRSRPWGKIRSWSPLRQFAVVLNLILTTLATSLVPNCSGPAVPLDPSRRERERERERGGGGGEHAALAAACPPQHTSQALHPSWESEIDECELDGGMAITKSAIGQVVVTRPPQTLASAHFSLVNNLPGLFGNFPVRTGNACRRPPPPPPPPPFSIIAFINGCGERSQTHTH